MNVTSTEITQARRAAGVEDDPAARPEEFWADEFWDRHPLLDQVRGWAKSRRIGPYALLLEILLQVAARVPPHVMLPPLGNIAEGTGAEGAASLNQIYASVAPSGLSKGQAHAIAGQVVEWPKSLSSPVYASLGTGEGIAATFVACNRDPDTKQYVMTRIAWSAILSATEVDKMAALITRKNATLGGTLRSGWSGEPLGEANATEDKRRYVPRNAYRLGMVIHVQPGRGGALLNEEEEAGGTPQRILWLPAQDPDIPDIAPAPPGRIVWTPATELVKASRHLLGGGGLDQLDAMPPLLLPVCNQALREIDRAAVARHRGEAGALDGHALLVREKLAATLGIFLGHFGVDEDDWDLAGHLMRVSTATREGINRELRKVAEQENETRGKADVKRARMVRQAEESDEVRRVTNQIHKRLSGQGWVKGSDLRRAVRSDLRKYLDEVLDMLVEQGRIVKQEVSRESSGHGGAGVEYQMNS